MPVYLEKGVPVERLIGRRDALALIGMPAALSLGSALAGCGTGGKKLLDIPPAIAATDLTARVKTTASAQEPIGDTLADQTATHAAFDFAARLLQGVCSAGSQDNALVSPLSALFALALAESGAAGETLSQLETATGMDIGALTSYLDAYARRISGEPLYDDRQRGDALALKSANSIWLRASDDLTVSDGYLATCKASLSAQAFSAPFDTTTVDDINSWVSYKTDGMIDRLVDHITAEDQLFLINALAFDGVWEEPYDDGDVQDDTFTTEGGDEQDVRMMRSHETTYLENDLAEGFLKPYENYDFAFVALLPKQGARLADLLASLDGTSLHALVANAIPNVEAEAGLPKFSIAYQATLNDQLAAMGAHDAFDFDRADFSRMATARDANLAISVVLQKTFIDVNETGTKAAAATSIDMEATSTEAPTKPEIREVTLDRPFAYLIIDSMTMTPLFTGVVTSVV